MACPHISKDITESEFNKKLNYKDFGGRIDYTFWEHTDPDGNVTRVQFCKKIGRKKDVFECMNENEYRNCRAFSE